MINPVSLTPMIPDYEAFCIWEKAFTPSQCQTIKDMGELAEFQKGRVGTGDQGRVDRVARDSDITWISETHETAWLFEFMSQLGRRINYDKFALDLVQFDGFQYTTYKKEQHYDWHTDLSILRHDRLPHLMRKLSFSVMLSDPATYEGGELLINASGNPDTAVLLKPDQGSVVVFYSFVPHKVAPVTKGDRATLVTWALGPRLK